MRITQNQVIRDMVYVINKRYSELTYLQEQLSTGKRLLRPSDDPVDTANDLKLRTDLAGLAQFKSNIEDAQSWMNVTETAMTSMNKILQRLRELAVQGSNDTLSSKERAYINKEVEQLTKQFVGLTNTKYKSDYIFSGTETKIPTLVMQSSAANTAQDYADRSMAYFNAAGTAVPATVQLFSGRDGTPITNLIPGTFTLAVGTTTYTEGVDYTLDYAAGTITLLNAALLQDVTPGNAGYAAGQFAISFDYLTKGKNIYGATVSNHGQIYREIDQGISVPINISGDDFLNDPTTGADLVATLIGMGQALLQNDQSGISSSIDRIDSVMKAALSAQSKNGARINRMENTLSRNEAQNNATTELLANLEDAEMTKTVTDFMNTQNIYNAALKSAAGVIQESLVNFL